MITHKKSCPNHNDPAAAKNIVLQTLLPLGFEITNDYSNGLNVNGPGYRSTRQPPLYGISSAALEFRQDRITIDAELGGINQISRLLVAVLISVGVVNSAIFLTLWFYLDTLRANTWFLFIPALTLLPWIIIAPLIIRFVHRRCSEAIDTLLRNASGDYS